MGYQSADNVSSIIASGGLVVADGTHRSYSHNDLSCFNLLRQPIWVFDIVNKKMWWANDAGLQFWQASSVEELCGRSFASVSETVHRKNMDTLERMKRNERWGETVSIARDTFKNNSSLVLWIGWDRLTKACRSLEMFGRVLFVISLVVSFVSLFASSQRNLHYPAVDAISWR